MSRILDLIEQEMTIFDAADVADLTVAHDKRGSLSMLEEVEKFIEDPAHWSRQRGGISGL